MKSKRSKKRIVFTGISIISILFLSLAATDRIIQTPVVIVSLSSGVLLILPFLQRGKSHQCNCNNSKSQ